jgi:peptidyl-prolyl cis-trans isomerase D
MRASLILVAVAPNASADDKTKAKQKADALLAQVKAHPDDFAKVAEQSSQDPASASKGGDLGYFGRGMMAGGQAFDDAAFKLKKDEISDVVPTDVGYLILKATDVKPSVTQPFDTVKDAIAKDLKTQLAGKAFSDDSDGFTSVVYEQAKSLQPAADKYKLQIQTATVTPQPNAALPPGSPLNNAKFLSAVFANDSVQAHNNIAAHVTDYKPAAVPPLDTVKDAVRQKVIAVQADELAHKEGIAKLAELQKSNANTGFSAPLKVSRNDAQGLPPAALSAIYKADAQKLPAYVGVDLGDAGYAVYRVNAVVPGAPIDPQRLVAAQQQIAQAEAQSEVEAYVQALRARSKVKFYGSLDSAQAGGD